MVKTVGIYKNFWGGKQGEIKAVLPTDIFIEKGEVFGLLGPNGAGKTTFLRMLATVLSPTGGTGRVNGYDILKEQEDVKKSIGFLSGNTKLYGRLTPKEILEYFGSLYGMSKQKIKVQTERVVELLGIGEYLNRQIEKLSTGQTQKVSIARCIFHDPELYILDEPTNGLDIITSQVMLSFVRKEAEKGKTVILSTHYMEEVELLCTRIGLIHKGKIIAVDSIDKLKERYNKKHITEVFIECVKNQERESL